jgi:hypothetical protein
MAKATPAPRINDPAITVDQRRVARGDKASGTQGWARAQIRMAVEALHRDGAPLEALTNSQIAARCAKWMRERQRKLDGEIPRPRSFQRHLSGILVEVFAGPGGASG